MKKGVAFVTLLFVAFAALPWSFPTMAQSQSEKEAPAGEPARTEFAMFGAGCFWGVEAAFRKVPGVLDAESGYSGGHVQNPSYKQVCTDRTGHAEVVRVRFDPARVSYGKLLQVFWEIHDPTTPNRQGPDVGSQYRSAIYTYSKEQQQEAEASKQEAQKHQKRPIVTEIRPASQFYRAEEYHQRYFEKNGFTGCHL